MNWKGKTVWFPYTGDERRKGQVRAQYPLLDHDDLLTLEIVELPVPPTHVTVHYRLDTQCQEVTE